MKRTLKTSQREQFPSIQALAMHHNRSIIILDLETTGFHSGPPGIVEFAYLAVHPDGEVRQQDHLINPGRAITAGASRVHGIYDRDVAHLEEFAPYVPLVERFFRDGVVSGFSSRTYDVRVLRDNCERYGSPVDLPRHQLDVRDLWKRLTGQQSGKLTEVAGHFGVTPGIAHRAAGDVLTTARVLETMLARHGLELALEDASALRRASVPVRERVAPREPAVVKPVRPRAPSVSAQAKNRVLSWVHEQGAIAEADFPVLARQLGCPETTIAFQVSDLYRAGDLSAEQVMDARLQERIAAVIDEAIREVGSAVLLKPVKVALDERLGEDVSYVQLRVALDQRSERAMAPAPMMGMEARF